MNAHVQASPSDSARTLVVDGRAVGPVLHARTWWARSRGMLLRQPLPAALWLEPCSSVHGVGMSAALDVAFLAEDGQVIDVTVLRPWRLTSPRQDARAVLEAPAGSFPGWGLSVGSLVRLA
ncbi:DUF192 domain-containing protein [Xylanimonas oleitrophica]|uniref:DUF192 domain-containing protein n=1 Tax=Xylanimonas oleitrophica TaxID=2607479 RepID=UPI001C54CBF3|nr:DUF192 domain-containing protein [Xylanimonas oleitrophica]